MPEVVVAIIFGVFGWVVWVITTNIRRSKAARAVADLHAKLLDRCSSNNELLMYLESESGRRFLEVSVDQRGHSVYAYPKRGSGGSRFAIVRHRDGDRPPGIGGHGCAERIGGSGSSGPVDWGRFPGFCSDFVCALQVLGNT